jgi:hypothetical protein
LSRAEIELKEKFPFGRKHNQKTNLEKSLKWKYYTDSNKNNSDKHAIGVCLEQESNTKLKLKHLKGFKM